MKNIKILNNGISTTFQIFALLVGIVLWSYGIWSVIAALALTMICSAIIRVTISSIPLMKLANVTSNDSFKNQTCKGKFLMYILAAFCSIFAVPFLLLNVWLWVSWPIIMLIVTLVGLVLSTISLCFSTKMQTYVYDYVCPEDNQDELKDKLSNLFENLGEKDDEDKTPEETD